MNRLLIVMKGGCFVEARQTDKGEVEVVIEDLDDMEDRSDEDEFWERVKKEFPNEIY